MKTIKQLFTLTNRIVRQKFNKCRYDHYKYRYAYFHLTFFRLCHSGNIF